MLQKLKPLAVARKLKEKKLRLFTPLEFKRVFDVSVFATSWFLKTYSREGLLIKLRNGLYALTNDLPNHYAIANRLYEPSYISLDTALSFHHVIPETIYAITSVTTKATREFTAAGVRFTYQKIKQAVYTGYKSVVYLGETILMAEPEKALADYLYFIDLHQRSLQYERMDMKKIIQNKLFRYVKLYQRPRMIKLVDQLYVHARKPQRVY